MKSKTTKTENWVLIQEDPQLFNSLVERAELLFPHVLRLRNAFDELETPEAFNDEIYRQVLSEPGQVEKKYKYHLEQELNNAGVRNTVLRANLLQGTENRLENLKTSRKELVERAKGLLTEIDFPLDTIMIIDGQPAFEFESQVHIMERYCRTYLKTEQEKNLYEKLLKFQDSYNELILTFDTFKFRDHFQGLESLNVYVEECGNKTIEVKAEAVQIITEYSGLRSNH